MPNTPPESALPPDPALPPESALPNDSGSDSGSDSQLSKLSPTYPSRDAWFHFFDKALLIIGAVALVLAVVFFIAYNWANMGKIGKFALVEGALSLSIIGYIILAYQRRFQLAQQLLLLAACVLTGSLLALFGQTYQTGADTWQLFFNWALLIIPWVLIARLPALWLLWLALINLSIPLFVNTTGFLYPTIALDSHIYGHNDSLQVILQTLFNSIALAVWVAMTVKPTAEHLDPSNPKSLPLVNSNLNATDTGHLDPKSLDKSSKLNFTKQILTRNHHWSVYLLGAITTYYATSAGILAVSSYSNELSTLVNLLLWITFIGYLYWRFRRQQIDVLMLTYGCISVLFVVIFWLASPLLNHANEAGFLLLTLLVSGMSAGSVFWLRSLHSEDAAATASPLLTTTEPLATTNTDLATTDPDNHLAYLDTTSASSSESLPWYLHLLIGLGGMISGVSMIGFIALILSNYIEHTITQLLVGITLAAISLFIFFVNRKQLGSTQVFVSSIAFPLSFSGQLFLIFALYDILDSEPLLAVAIIIIQAVFYLTIKDFLHRLFSALVALSAMIWLLTYYHAPELSAAMLALVLCVFSLQSDQLLSFITPQKQALASALCRPFTHASMLLLLTVSVVFIAAEYGQDIANATTEFYYHYPLAQGLMIAVSLYATHLLLARYRIGLTSKTGMIIASAVVILGILSVYVSGLLATCLVLVIAKANQQKSIMALAITALVGYIFWYYYQLDTSLLVKSYSMLAVGVALLLTHWILKRHYDSNNTSYGNNINHTDKEHGL
ncbi:DUF4401 domain-containing protein [Psychrobacter lutiphocae]|uniref:DUF4401 domain-containing protein n=1 Tax=Psychrobacter lutiphocae TaxID=540500 RepID=UPI00037CE747|nr:DUF4401 domain-containing protein [Psychrobacter lutiphocae]